MAKKKSASMEVGCCALSPRVYLDVKSIDDLEDLKVGEPVTIVIQGKVSSISQREGYEDTKVKGEIAVSDYSLKITGKSELEELMEDDDD